MWVEREVGVPASRGQAHVHEVRQVARLLGMWWVVGAAAAPPCSRRREPPSGRPHDGRRGDGNGCYAASEMRWPSNRYPRRVGSVRAALASRMRLAMYGAQWASSSSSVSSL